MMPDLNALLKDRGKSYGSYTSKTAFVQDMKDRMRSAPNWATMHDGGREALDMIATKIGRLLHGDPLHRDSWIDIAGYAQLAADGDVHQDQTTLCCAHNQTHLSRIDEITCDDCGFVLAEPG